MLFFQCRPRFRVAYRVVLAVVVSVAGASPMSFADEPKPDAATLQATEKESLRGVLTPEQQKKFDDLPPMGGGRGPGGPGGKKEK